MDSFQAKIGLKRPRMRENKNYRSVPFRPDAKLKIPKIAIKLRKLKYTIMASFQAKIGWKMPRKRENKNRRFVLFLHDALPIFPPDAELKISKKK